MFRRIRGLKYWCGFHIQNKFLARISQSMKTSRWKMDVCPGLLLVIVKYSHWYFWSAAALLCWRASWHTDEFFRNDLIWPRRSERAASGSQVRRYLDAGIWVGWGGMMQVGESVFEMFLSVWCSWHSELCRWSAIKLFEHVGWLKASDCWKLLKCKTDIGKFRILCETCKRNIICVCFIKCTVELKLYYYNYIFISWTENTLLIGPEEKEIST